MKKLMLILCVAGLAGCYNDSKQELYPAVATPNNPNNPGTGCDTANLTFAAKVLPVFTQNCALSGCHNSTTRAANYDLSGHAGAKAAADGGRLLGAIKHLPNHQPMPQGKPKLDDCSIAKVEKWISLGTKND